MFVGQHEHSLDAKGRVVLPVSFRSAVVDRGYVTNLGSCIGLWDEEGFRTITEELKKLLVERTLSQDDFRKMMRETRQVNLDAAGRITMPRELLDELGFDKEVIITGRLDRVEIWPKALFEEKSVDAESNAKLADTIDHLGL